MNKPKYQIGDRIECTNFEVCGVMTTSLGVVRYWLRANDNCLTVNENELELIVAIALYGKTT